MALDKVEIQTLLSGIHDREGAFLTVHAGAGGTEACDWADMLVRMYQRWGTQQGFKVEMIDVQEGEEVGIRGATLRFEGENAFGYLRCEHGVHRLVRISPFDSQARRHTDSSVVFDSPFARSDAIASKTDGRKPMMSFAASSVSRSARSSRI